MQVSELIAALSKHDKTLEVQAGFSVGEGRYRERKSVSVKRVGDHVLVAGESREPKAKTTATKSAPAKAAAKSTKSTTTKSAPAKTTAKSTKAAKTK